MSSRFIVRYRGSGTRPSDTVDMLRRLGVHIVEDTGRMLLVEGEEARVSEALRSDGPWLVTPETVYAPPDPRRRIR